MTSPVAIAELRQFVEEAFGKAGMRAVDARTAADALVTAATAWATEAAARSGENGRAAFLKAMQEQNFDIDIEMHLKAGQAVVYVATPNGRVEIARAAFPPLEIVKYQS